MKTKQLSLMALAATILLFTACKKDDESPVECPKKPTHEEEVITTLKLIFTDSANNVTEFTYADVDGLGGNPPIADEIILDASKTYTVSTEVWNESETPAEDLTGEITDEADEHLFCYTVNSGDFAVTTTDMDANMLPIGLSTSWTTGATTGSGQITVILKHQPGIKDGTCTPGETDVEAHFDVTLN